MVVDPVGLNGHPILTGLNFEKDYRKDLNKTRGLQAPYLIML
jgi:hypothetical protein